MSRVLVVDDEPQILRALSTNLRARGFEVDEASTGEEALELAARHRPDAVVLDLGLPGIDGIETCRRIRETSDVYIVMITARDEEIDRLIGLETGADDFLSKPFSPRELQARVNALFRRPRHTTQAVKAAPEPLAELANEVLDHGPLRVDVDGRRAFRDETELSLTRTEFDLLTELMRTPARVWTREALLRSVWGTDWATDTHLVEVHIGNLRRKLGESGKLVRTVRGVGYRMDSL